MPPPSSSPCACAPLPSLLIISIRYVPHPPWSPRPVLATSTGRSRAPHFSEKRSAPALRSDAAAPNLGVARYRHCLYPRTTLLLERPLVRPRSSPPRLKARWSRTPRLPDKAGFSLGRAQWQLHLTSAFLFAHAQLPASKMRGGRIGTTPTPASPFGALFCLYPGPLLSSKPLWGSHNYSLVFSSFGGSIFSFRAFFAFLVAAPLSPRPRSHNGAICAINNAPDPQIGLDPQQFFKYERRQAAFFTKRDRLPYVGEGPGLIYIVVSFKNADGAAFRASDGKDAMPFLAQLRIKGGLTQKHRMERRHMEAFFVPCDETKDVYDLICAT
ncbi:hypothetical protein K438DRAFT_1990457 [Mycena galopus ATCC 62051]|nr:hypothetical protein K438DRAFT_1990457 [Mycena galopus ATCC 62051]